jgi:hypothetical protein
VAVEAKELKVTEQLHCKLAQQYVTLQVIVKKEDKLGGKTMEDSRK